VDIKERKMTLPLIHTLRQSSPGERRRLIRLVKYRHNDPAAVETVMRAVIDGPGMGYAREKMAALRDEAIALLDGFPASDAKRALVELVDFTIDRKK
jgi:octaprenyl-diphosphate synthase